MQVKIQSILKLMYFKVGSKIYIFFKDGKLRNFKIEQQQFQVDYIPLDEGLATHSSILAWRIP